MHSNTHQHPKRAVPKVALLACVCLLLTIAWLLHSVFHPPNLAGCTRVEIRYEDGALHHLLSGATSQEGLLDQQEKDYIQSYDKWTLTDRERIDALARYIGKGVYQGVAPGPVAGYGIYMTGYREGAPPTTFVMYSETVIDGKNRAFHYSFDLGKLPAIEPPGIKTVKTRWDCALNLAMLETERMLRRKYNHLDLDPNHWCDDLVESFRLHDRNDEVIAKIFACPSVHRAVDANVTHPQASSASLSSQPSRVRSSDYAMNPDCEPNSPKDVVFLFEAKPGWNQHGGAELFTFDNHDPKGGCVRLNGGKVRFIRTEEELKQLRWK